MNFFIWISYLTIGFFIILGYAQWQVDRSQDDVYLASQESAGQHRDAQGELNQTILYPG